MATYAVLNGDMVENVIVAEDKELVEQALNVRLIEYTPDNTAGIGWRYDAETGRFTPPIITEDDIIAV